MQLESLIDIRLSERLISLKLELRFIPSAKSI